MSKTVPVAWRQIERALADYLNTLGVTLVSDDGEIRIEAGCCDAIDEGPFDFLLSDLARYLERVLAS